MLSSSILCYQQRQLLSRRFISRCVHRHHFSTNGSSKVSSSANSHTTNRHWWAIGTITSTTLLGIGTTLYINDHVGGTDGLSRTINFYSLAIPKYIQYRYHMEVNSPNEVWDKLHEETSKAGLDKIMELQGFYVKSGQMCAANIGNAFPPIWQDTMVSLFDVCCLAVKHYEL